MFVISTASISINIKLYTDHVMLYNLDHAEYIDQCVRVSSAIRILSDMRMPVFVDVKRLPDMELTWKSLFTNSQNVNSKLTIWMLKLFSISKVLQSKTRLNVKNFVNFFQRCT